jgi:uncharacterized membrane protein
MAGVGFELRRLFGNKGFFTNLRAYFVSTVITVGPTVLCILLMTSGERLLRYYGESYINRELFLGTLTYAFDFSLIITGGYSMLTSRYIADCLFEKKFNNIMPSLFGICVVSLGTAFLTGILFFQRSPIALHVKILSYTLYAELAIIWIQTVYLSCIKNYIKIVRTFIIGGLVIVVSVFLLIYSGIVPLLESVIFSIILGFFIMLISFFIILYKTFGVGEFSIKNCFEFLKSVDKYWELIFIGTLFFLGLFGHNFVFWLSEEGVVIKNTYRLYPTYDVAAFYALLTILPAMVIFIVKVETAFYEKYKLYYNLVLGEGSIKDISVARTDMNSTLSSELRYIIEVQFFISFMAVIIGMRILPFRGLSSKNVDIFSILALGSLSYVTLYLVTLILLYYDDRKGALYVSIFFCISSIGFSFLTLYIGDTFYGDGFFLSTLLSMMFALLRLRNYLININYYTFGLQPIFVKENKGPFTRIYNAMVRLEEKYR